MAQAGNNIVADCVLSEPWRLLDCLTVMADCEVATPPPAATPLECAILIKEFLARAQPPAAFDRLRALLLGD
ncbi:MAG: hypothetical protein ACLPN6_14310 [Streptosporangiaceae bacterium]|jgi:chloramphenicol 3-O phosphotransferase